MKVASLKKEAKIMVNGSFIYGSNDIAVHITANQWEEGGVFEVRVMRAAKPYLRSIGYPPRNGENIRQAGRARELGLQVEVPAPAPQWDGPNMDPSRFLELVGEIWEGRYFSPEVGGWVVSPPSELIDELQEAGGAVKSKGGSITISAWVGREADGSCLLARAKIGTYSSDSPWPEAREEVPELIRELCDDLARVAAENFSRVKKARENEERLRLAAKFGLK